jgi:hypothetical protein
MVALAGATGLSCVPAGAGRAGERPPATPAAAGGEPAGTVVAQWNEAALQAIRVTRPSPPVAARALATAHTCIYDAWAAYDAVAAGTQLGSALRRPVQERTAAHKRAAISYAAHRALADLFPAERDAFDGVLASLGYPPGAEPTQVSDGAMPLAVGLAAAQAVLDFRHGDGANQTGGYADTTDYAPVNAPDELRDPNHWQPLRVPDGQGGSRTQAYAAPHWGQVRPFALTSGSQFRPAAGPQLYPDGGYQARALQLVEFSAGLTDRHKAIAEYWSDGPATEQPPGHWCLLAQAVARRDGHDLDADVKLFFALANAVFDASIAAWDAKRAFDFVRPITAIRHLFGGRQIRAWGGPYKGTANVDGAAWRPYQPATFVTPPFAEYVSGHSTFSAAAAEVLKRFTRSDTFGVSVTIPPGSSRIEPGRTPAAEVVLAWDTFSAAADQAGLSRRYGGIHFEDGDLAGRALGRAVGAAAWGRAQAYIHGAA